MTRFPDWEQRLAKLLREMPAFEWGKSDCALFACDVVKELTGVDPAEKFRNRYFTKSGARRVICNVVGSPKATLANLAEKVAAEYGMTEVPPMLAHRGDVVLVRTENGQALGIIGMDGWSVRCIGQTGELDRTFCERAWRVG